MNEITYRQSGDYLIPELEYPAISAPAGQIWPDAEELSPGAPSRSV